MKITSGFKVWMQAIGYTHNGIKGTDIFITDDNQRGNQKGHLNRLGGQAHYDGSGSRAEICRLILNARFQIAVINFVARKACCRHDADFGGI